MRKFFLLLLLTALSGCLYARQADSLTSYLHRYSNSLSDEKIYIHFDKPFYVVGDTIWFKIYLIDARSGILSSRSRVAYIDIQKSGSAMHQLAIPIQTGMGSGQLVLTDTLYSPGKYMIRAYTNWMRNGSKDYFFYHTLTVGNIPDLGVAGHAGNTAIKSAPSTLALDFFPEGGWLVDGLRAKVAFKAVNSEGRSRSIKGYVADDQGRQVALFESGYGGMGTFSFLPETGRHYVAVISEGEYKDYHQPLPAAKTSGYVLSVNPLGADRLRVRVSRTAGPATVIHMVVQANGVVQQATSLPFQHQSIVFSIDKSHFTEGINQLTLFSSDLKPLAERIFFVYKDKLTTGMLTCDKEVYQRRSAVKIELLMKDDEGKGVIGGYSVAVVHADKMILPEEEQQSIYAGLLLSADLRGRIENPNYYFTAYDSYKAAALDVLMLTQGWRRFSWKDVLEQRPPLQKFRVEDGLSISGTVTDRNGKGINGAKVNLLAAKQLLFLDTLTNEQGDFSFANVPLEGQAEVIVRARGAKEKDKVHLVLSEKAVLGDMINSESFSGEGPLPSDKALPIYSAKTEALSEKQQINRGGIQGTTLKEVEIIAKKKIPEIKGSVYPFAAAPPDYTFEPDKLQEMVNLESYLRGLTGVMVGKDNEILGRYPPFSNKSVDADGKVVPTGKPVGPMVILLNGMAIKSLAGINPRALTGVQIVTGGMTAMNMASGLMLSNDRLNEHGQFPGYGIVLLTMGDIPAKFIKAERPDGFVQFTMNGYPYAREFYAPRYDTQKEKPARDYRSTLFWKPDIITDEDGSALFDFYTSDEPGRYQITLEGVGANGELTRIIRYFEVK